MSRCYAGGGGRRWAKLIQVWTSVFILCISYTIAVSNCVSHTQSPSQLPLPVPQHPEVSLRLPLGATLPYLADQAPCHSVLRICSMGWNHVIFSFPQSFDDCGIRVRIKSVASPYLERRAFTLTSSSYWLGTERGPQ